MHAQTYTGEYTCCTYMEMHITREKTHTLTQAHLHIFTHTHINVQSWTNVLWNSYENNSHTVHVRDRIRNNIGFLFIFLSFNRVWYGKIKVFRLKWCFTIFFLYRVCTLLGRESKAIPCTYVCHRSEWRWCPERCSGGQGGLCGRASWREDAWAFSGCQADAAPWAPTPVSRWTQRPRQTRRRGRWGPSLGRSGVGVRVLYRLTVFFFLFIFLVLSFDQAVIKNSPFTC